jgi:hypothetical protein
MPIYHKCSRPSIGNVVQDDWAERSVFARPKANILAMTAMEVRSIMRLVSRIEGRMQPCSTMS